MTTDDATELPPTPAVDAALQSLLDHFIRIAEAAAGMRSQLIDQGFSEHAAEHIVVEYVNEVIIGPLGVQTQLQAEDFYHQLHTPPREKTAFERFIERLNNSPQGD